MGFTRSNRVCCSVCQFFCRTRYDDDGCFPLSQSGGARFFEHVGLWEIARKDPATQRRDSSVGAMLSAERRCRAAPPSESDSYWIPQFGVQYSRENVTRRTRRKNERTRRKSLSASSLCSSAPSDRQRAVQGKRGDVG